MTKRRRNKAQEVEMIDVVKAALDEQGRSANREEVKKLVMDVLEVTVNDWDKAITTDEGMARLMERFNEAYKKKPPGFPEG